jgi:hypothetical protein
MSWPTLEAIAQATPLPVPSYVSSHQHPIHECSRKYRVGVCGAKIPKRNYDLYKTVKTVFPQTCSGATTALQPVVIDVQYGVALCGP